MAWRDEIADRARNGDAEGVLKIFDELDKDRERIRTLNAAYLQHIAELVSSGHKTDRPVPTIDSPAGAAVLEACARARAAATDARKAVTAGLGAL